MNKILKSFVTIFFTFICLSYSPNAQIVQPYVLLISLDGFRWDYPDRGLSPNLQFLEENGVRSLSLRPVFPTKTFPNHISIVTGLYPENHGIILNSFKNPFSGELYRIGDTSAVRDPKWYSAEFIWETANKQGIITASHFWPGSELRIKSKRPTYYKKYDHNLPYAVRVKTVLNWLKLPQKKRPHFITLYFHETDSQGHDFGPNSEQTNNAIKVLDQQIGDLIKGIKNIGLKDSINIIVVSDHGMSEISPDRIINVEKLLDGKKCEFWGSGPIMMINPLEDGVLKKLKSKKHHFYAYRKNNIPAFYHFTKNVLISPIVLIAEPGYSLITNRGEKRGSYTKDGGNHGYEKDLLDMHGIFIASGPAFKSSYRTGTLWNIDIYPLICEILGIIPTGPIDGKLERIEFILKEN